MFFSRNKVPVTLLLTLASVSATQIAYLTNVTKVWEESTSSVQQGNGVFLSPNGDTAVVVSRDATVRAFDILTGNVTWTFPPPTSNSESFSGAFFITNSTTPYIAYSVVFGGGINSQVIALDVATGKNLFTTGFVDGAAVGTPVTTADGKYIFMTHNVNGAIGHFSIFDTSNPGTPVYNYTNNFSEPFGAIGYYWRPMEGYFAGGEGNSNDVFIWSLANDIVNTTVGTGQVFGFQLPVISGSAFNVTLIGDTRSWQTSLPPILTNDGYSMYWSVSRSNERCWVGEPGLKQNNFGKKSLNSHSFTKGQPGSASALAPPTLSSDPVEPFVYGPTASNQIFRFNYNFTDTPMTVVTAAVVSSRVLVSTDDQLIYYATPSPDGKLYQLNATTLVEQWSIFVSKDGIAGEIAQSKDGSLIIVADVAGFVRAYRVANVAPSNSTFAPTAAPTGNSTAPPPTNSTGLTSTNSTVPPSTNSTAPTSTNSTVPTSTNSTVPLSGTPTAAPSGNSTAAPSGNLTTPPSRNSSAAVFGNFTMVTPGNSTSAPKPSVNTSMTRTITPASPTISPTPRINNTAPTPTSVRNTPTPFAKTPASLTGTTSSSVAPFHTAMTLRTVSALLIFAFIVEF